MVRGDLGNWQVGGLGGGLRLVLGLGSEDRRLVGRTHQGRDRQELASTHERPDSDALHVAKALTDCHPGVNLILVLYQDVNALHLDDGMARRRLELLPEVFFDQLEHFAHGHLSLDRKQKLGGFWQLSFGFERNQKSVLGSIERILWCKHNKTSKLFNLFLLSNNEYY